MKSNYFIYVAALLCLLMVSACDQADPIVEEDLNGFDAQEGNGIYTGKISQESKAQYVLDFGPDQEIALKAEAAMVKKLPGNKRSTDKAELYFYSYDSGNQSFTSRFFLDYSASAECDYDDESHCPFLFNPYPYLSNKRIHIQQGTVRDDHTICTINGYQYQVWNLKAKYPDTNFSGVFGYYANGSLKDVDYTSQSGSQQRWFYFCISEDMGSVPAESAIIISSSQL